MTGNKIEKVLVITSEERRRRWSGYEKQQIVSEMFETGRSVSYVARQHNISSSQLLFWRHQERLCVCQQFKFSAGCSGSGGWMVRALQ
jgi:transposase-like protein